MCQRPSQRDWIAALTRAALPGAVMVTFTRAERLENGTPTMAFSLRSHDGAGRRLGDGRDHDLLKAVMVPLERLAETENAADLTVTLDLNTRMLSIQ